MGIIVVGEQEIATNADILQGTRLQTVPKNGFLLFELAASDNIAANRFTTSILLPNGDNPVNLVPVPQGAPTAGIPGVLDDRLALRLRFRIGQGGHCVFSCVLTGAAEFTWRVTYTPAPIAVR